MLYCPVLTQFSSIIPVFNDLSVGIQTIVKGVWLLNNNSVPLPLLTISGSDIMDGPQVVSRGHTYLPILYILLAIENGSIEIWAIQPISRQGAIAECSCITM